MTKKLDKRNVLIIGDSHLPFEQKGYLEFCLKIKKEHNCGTVVHIGDLVDNHSISYHEHDPDLQSPEDEMKKVDIILKSWFKAFPNMYLCKGNHDILVDRKAKTSHLPKRCFKPFREIWNLPKGWKDDFSFIIDNVLYTHGTGNSGKLAHLNLALHNRMSTVIGHSHSFAGIAFTASPRDCIFGMNVGSGVDNSALAFAYGKDLKSKPIVSCGIISNGEDPCIFRMRL
jgi:predicted phosphodiesterase